MEVIRPLNDMYRKAVDYQTYQLLNTRLRYYKTTAKSTRKMSKNIPVQMRNLMFNGHDPIPILSFLESIKFACDANDMHEVAAMRLFQYFMKGRAQRSLLAKTNESVGYDMHLRRKFNIVYESS